MSGALSDGAIAHAAAEHAALGEAWKELKAAYAKDLQPESPGIGVDVMSGNSAPQTFGQVWDGVVSAEKEARSLERSMPEPSIDTPTMSGTADAMPACSASPTAQPMW